MTVAEWADEQTWRVEKWVVTMALTPEFLGDRPDTIEQYAIDSARDSLGIHSDAPMYIHRFAVSTKRQRRKSLKGFIVLRVFGYAGVERIS